MGGQNHQPTNRASQMITVLTSKALSSAFSELMLANVSIEDAIIAEPGCRYGVSRSHLDMAAGHMLLASMQLTVFTDLCNETISLLRRGDYEPFVAAVTLGPLKDFVQLLIKNGLLPESTATYRAATLLEQGSYESLFAGYVKQAAIADEYLGMLQSMTAEMRDSEGFQGLFWIAVEANSRPWRQYFTCALTEMSDLQSLFQAGAMISTETYLLGMKSPRLLENFTPNVNANGSVTMH